MAYKIVKVESEKKSVPHSKVKSKLIRCCKFVGIGFIGIMAVCYIKIQYIGTEVAQPTDNIVKKFALSGIVVERDMQKELQEKLTKLEYENLQLKSNISEKNSKTDLLKNSVIKAIDKNLNGILKGMGSTYYDSGKQQKVNPMLMAAISIHETANGTSKVLKECNNVAGINWDGVDNSIPHKGRYRVFPNVQDSIYNLGYILKTFYIDEDRLTIEDIGKKYCPISDPDNMKYGMDNSSWIPNVTNLYLKILEDVKNS